MAPRDNIWLKAVTRATVGRTEVGFGDIDAALKRMEGRDVFGKIILRVG